MTTSEAFENLLTRRGFYHECGITPEAARNLRRNHKAGLVTLDRMEALLTAAGYVKKPEVWKKKKAAQ